MNNNDKIDELLGIPLEKRRMFQQRAIEEMDNEWEKLLDEQNKDKSLAKMNETDSLLNSLSKSLNEISESNEAVVDLNSTEIVFLYYINKKKTDLSNVAGYWMYSPNYNINISDALKKFLKSGLIKRSCIEYDLKKATISQLKEYAKKHNLTVKGNKNQIVMKILNYIEHNELKKEFGGKFFLATEKGYNIINQNEEIIFFHHYITKFGVSLYDVDLYKNNHKKMSCKDIFIGVILEKLAYYQKKGINLERNFNYGLSEVYKYFNDLENQLICLLVVCYFDYDFSIDKKLTPFVPVCVDSINELIKKMSISKNDFNHYLKKCEEKISYKHNFLEFEKCILNYLNKEIKKIQVNDPIEFLGEYYKNGKRKDISPYYMNYVVNELMNDLENNFVENMEIGEKISKTEQAIVYIMNDILNDDTMSKYQLSLTCKRIGDYYYNCKMWSGAMNMYTIGLELNTKLAVKKKLKETQEKSRG